MNDRDKYNVSDAVECICKVNSLSPPNKYNRRPHYGRLVWLAAQLDEILKNSYCPEEYEHPNPPIPLRDELERSLVDQIRYLLQDNDRS